jgi:transposase-like protein
MDPRRQFCHHPDCSARGQVGQGNSTIHRQQEQRYRCTACGRTVPAPLGTPFYRLRTAVDVVTLGLPWLCPGGPLQAIVAACGFEERTVAQWQARGGHHCRHVHGHLVQQGHVDLGHVSADELGIKMGGQRVWMALAWAVPSRLGLGGVSSPHRDRCSLGHRDGRQGPGPPQPGSWPGITAVGVHPVPRPVRQHGGGDDPTVIPFCAGRARQPGAPGTGLRDTDEACGLRGQLTGALSAIGGSCTDGPRGDDVGLRVFGAKGHSEGVLVDIQTARECARR